MNQAQQLLHDYDEAMHGDAWYGDPVWKILDGIDARMAAARPIAAAHSIWQLVKHMAFWERIGVQRAAGPVVPDETQNFPEQPVLDEAKWQQTLDEFRETNREFRALLEGLDPARLDQPTGEGKRSLRVELLGVLHHHIYHVGQIALLKKALL